MSGDNKKTLNEIQRRPLSKRGYTTTERIGEGAFGVILMARSKRHHRRMAIKVIEKMPNSIRKADFQWSIDNEKQFADLFDHPYINVYHEIIETSKRLYMVMDYFPDGTLMDYYDEVDHTPEPLAYDWFAQLCSALEYVHACGFAHRDVKLDNVLLDRQRCIRLADFGLCVATERPSTAAAGPVSAINASVPCGSVLYMSPELLALGPYRAQLADVWAAGVLLYCLVAGRFPFPLADGRGDENNGDDDGDDFERVIQSQKKGYSFNAKESQRISVECQSFFTNIFVNEANRKVFKELKKEDWMVRGAQNTNK